MPPFRRPPNKTVGIDLAAQSARTAVCCLDWTTDPPTAEILPGPWKDEALVKLLRDSDKVGIDCPLGWPLTFADAIRRHQQGERWPKVDSHSLTHRLTDRRVRERTGGPWPLSVSANWLAIVAFRCAGLISQLDQPVDRAGSGVLAEVYPAAAIRAWDLGEPGSYKRSPQVLDRFVTRFLRRWPVTFALTTDEQRCRKRHDDFDALVCAVIAHEVACDRTVWPETDEERGAAAVEGWIHLPR